MSLPVVTVRPEPGCSATVAAGRDAGLNIHGHPLMRIVPRDWALPHEMPDALLLGSANAVRYAGARLAQLGECPVFAVGEATADEARAAGLKVAQTGTGGLQGLLDKLAGPPRLLRLAGEERVPLRPPPGVTLDTKVVYAAEPLPMSGQLAELLRQGPVVLLHSAAAARHFAGECERLEVPRGNVALAALGPRIAAAAGVGWQCCRSAAEPKESALLALAQELCHASHGGEG